MPQFRIRCTSIIYGDLVHLSHSSCFPYNTKCTSQRSVSCRGVNPQSLRPPPGLSVSPTAESSDPSWWVSPQPASPPPSHICALCRNHMCPQSLKQEVKDDLKEAFRKLSKQKWRMLSRALDRQAGLIQHEGPSPVGAAAPPPLPTRPSERTGGQPRKMRNAPQTQVPRHIPASNRAAYFLWQENLFIWGKWTHSING